MILLLLVNGMYQFDLIQEYKVSLHDSKTKFIGLSNNSSYRLIHKQNLDIEKQRFLKCNTI